MNHPPTGFSPGAATAIDSPVWLVNDTPVVVQPESVKSATLRHVWRPSRAANTACWYAEVYSGGALIGSHGSAGSPISCPTGSAWQTDSASLPELNTPARANDATVRMYFQVTGSGNRRTEQNLAELSVLYGQ